MIVPLWTFLFTFVTSQLKKIHVLADESENVNTFLQVQTAKLYI